MWIMSILTTWRTAISYCKLSGPHSNQIQRELFQQFPSSFISMRLEAFAFLSVTWAPLQPSPAVWCFSTTTRMSCGRLTSLPLHTMESISRTCPRECWSWAFWPIRRHNSIQFQGTPPSTEALIYCAGTQRDPLFHDAPSYDCYKTPVPPNDGKPKPELVLTLELICSETMAGELLCKLNLAPMTLGIARSHIRYGADPSLSYNIILALPGGQLLSMEHDSLTLSNLSELEGAASSSDQPQPAETSPADEEPARHAGSWSCCSLT